MSASLEKVPQAGIEIERYLDPETAQETMTINMGPSHPSTHGVLRLVLELDGETVVRCTPHIGYLHTGIEKTMENLSYYKALVLTDREDYLSNLCNNLAYSLAVEKLLDVAIPPKADYMRVLLNELERIASHCLWLGTHALDIGAMSMFFYTWQDRDRILELKEHLSGVRTKTSWICPGGLRGDAPQGWLERVRAFLDYFPARIELYEGLLTNNPIWIERTRGIGMLSAEQAIAFGMAGPSLRASGVAFDLRKTNPYSRYEEFDFDICVGTYGDVYDRYRVRMAELWESLKICEQSYAKVVEMGAKAPVRTADRKIAPPPRAELDTSMEALIHHFKLYTEGYHPPVGEAIGAVEGPRGEKAYYVVSDGSNKPYRVKIKGPSFYNLQALPQMCEGRMVADVVAIIGSIDIVLGDIDR
ncbi:NADH-quinone oxidoreductase subunit D [Armatimonas rosea]|uniref:NADH-quinone oxidoreductase subunit D n=2 Tax=Armatimonas rosea TaxID=685828 RepID=A0A7W9SWI8_ARMRO|nr:NADH dehydrogenase (quinone) subunit D [Armatimonas rosea]MBB6053708.1 NADH-quinone oxidoreductase subunit D [Armatimonas rosea]